MYLAEMCWQEAETHLKNTDNVIVIPVGSTEQHGSIGPLGTDWMIPQEFARRIADQPGVIVAPPVCYGVAPQHINFPGTVDIGLETMSVLIERMLLCWHRHGARRFCIINGHGGNDPAIDRAGLKLYRMGALVSLVDWWSIAPQLNKNWVTGHGDAQEVSAMMAIRPDIVKREYLKENIIPPLTENLVPFHMSRARFKGAAVRVIRDVRDTASTGGFGGKDSSEATPEWGQEMMAGTTEWIGDFIQEFRKVSLPEDRPETYSI